MYVTVSGGKDGYLPETRIGRRRKELINILGYSYEECKVIDEGG